MMIAITYRKNTKMIVSRTPKLPVSSRRLSSLKTVSMSIGLGATKRPPPNEVRWLHRQRRRCFVDRDPTWNIKDYCYNWASPRSGFKFNSYMSKFPPDLLCLPWNVQFRAHLRLKLHQVQYTDTILTNTNQIMYLLSNKLSQIKMIKGLKLECYKFSLDGIQLHYKLCSDLRDCFR